MLDLFLLLPPLLLLQIKLSTSINFTGQCYSRPGCEGESFPVGSARECCVGTDEGASYSDDGIGCTIPQCIVHGFHKVSFDASEGVSLNVQFGPYVKGESRFDSINLAGTVSLVEDTATSTDYESFRSMVISRATSIQFLPRDDHITLEYNDRVVLTFTPQNPHLLAGMEAAGMEAAGQYIRQNTTINIIDTDKFRIHFEEADYSVEEDEEAPPIRVVFTKTQNPFTLTARPVSIDVAATLNISAFVSDVTVPRAAQGSDFTGETVSVTVPPTEYNTSSTFQLPPVFRVIDDTVNEEDERFYVVVEVGSDTPDDAVCFKRGAGDTNCHGRSGAAQIEIRDNDETTFIGFAERSQTVSESEAPSGDDGYDNITVRINSAGSERRDYPVRIRVTSPINTTVEGINVQFNPSFDVLFGTRLNIDDPITYDLNVPRNIYSTSVSAFIRQDFAPEGLECFTLRINGLDAPGFRDISSCNEDSTRPTDYFCQHTVCIQDDHDPFTVAFVEPLYTVSECGDQVEVCVNLTQPQTDILDEVVYLDIVRNDTSKYIPPGSVLARSDAPTFLGTYTRAPLTDYEEQTLGVNGLRDSAITETSRVICYNQTVYCDVRLEPTEYFGLGIAVRGSSTARTEVDPVYGQTAVKVLDGNDMAEVCLENTVYHDVGELVEVCAIVRSPEVTCPIQFPFDVTLSTSDDSDPTIHFAECEVRSCVTILRGSLPVFLVKAPDMDTRINLCRRTARVFSVIVEFEREVYRVSEDVGSVSVCAVLRGDPAEVIRITLVTQDQTAQAETDYAHMTKINSVITGRLCMAIPIIDNYLPGSTRQFTVQVTSSSHTIPTATSTVIILDDDPLIVAFVEPLYTVSECGDQVEVCVNLTQPQTDILDEVVHLDIVRNDTSKYIPPGSVLARPDAPTFLGTYTRAPLTDYEEQTLGVNGLRDSAITETSRVICYNQTVYCDVRLEPTEYFGLGIAVRGSSTVRTEVDPVYGQTAVKILDGNDMAEVCLENTVYHDVGELVEVCAIVRSPEVTCPIQFPFDVTLSTSDDSDPTIRFAECEVRSCVTIPKGSFPVVVARAPDMDTRINLCPQKSRVFSVPINTRSSEVMIDNEDIFIMNGTTVTLTWSPEAIIPHGDVNQNVDIVLCVLDSDDSDTIVVRRNTDTVTIYLARDVPNSGSIRVTISVNSIFSKVVIGVRRLKRGLETIIGAIHTGVKYIYRVVESTITYVIQKIEEVLRFLSCLQITFCKKWARTQTLTKTNEIAQSLNPCPCRKASIVCNAKFRQERQNIFHSGATCFREVITSNGSCPPGQQCCYDGDGSLLIGPPSGGTIDFVSPSSIEAIAKHFYYDVLPHLYCCSECANMCHTYYKFRPSDDCTGSLQNPQG